MARGIRREVRSRRGPGDDFLNGKSVADEWRDKQLNEVSDAAFGGTTQTHLLAGIELQRCMSNL